MLLTYLFTKMHNITNETILMYEATSTNGLKVKLKTESETESPSEG